MHSGIAAANTVNLSQTLRVVLPITLFEFVNV